MASATIPIQIKTPSGADSSVRSFVVGMTDLIPLGYEGVRLAEQQYRSSLSKWKRLVSELRMRKSDPVIRWRLGNEINRFFRLLETRRGMVVTNQLEALSQDLGLSHDALSFIVRMPVVFTKLEVEASHLGWSKFQELMGIKNESSMRECLNLLRSGKIKYDKEIRTFKRKANRIALG
jgi:hypothetical protein